MKITCALCSAIQTFDKSHKCSHDFKPASKPIKKLKKDWSGFEWTEYFAQSDWEEYLKENPKWVY